MKKAQSRAWTMIRTANKTPEACRVSELSGALFQVKHMSESDSNH